MSYAPAINDLLLRVSQAWQWLNRGLHIFALPLLPFSSGHDLADAIDPDFWTT